MAIVVPREQAQALAQRACIAVGLREAFASEIPDYYADPLAFFRDVLGCELYPKQADMVLSVRDNEQISILGCNSCVGANTRIFNPLTGEYVPIAELSTDMPVLSMQDGKMTVAWAQRPFIKGCRPLYTVRLSDGNHFDATLEHRVLTPAGWQPVASLHVGEQIAASSPVLLEYVSSQARRSVGYALRSRLREEGYHLHYWPYHHQCDELPPLAINIGRCAFQQLVDAPGHIPRCCVVDDRENTQGYIHSYPRCVHPSRSGRAQDEGQSCGGVQCRGALESFVHAAASSPIVQQASRYLSAHARGEKALAGDFFPLRGPSSVAFHELATLYSFQSPQMNYSPTWATIQDIRYEGHAEFYDVHVPVTNNYLAEGAFHHNSGKDFAAARVALWWMATHEFAKVLITAPSARQINDVVWKELRSAYLETKRDLGGRLYESPRLEWDEHRFVTGFSTDKPYKLQGFHSRALLIIVSEAHGMRQADIEALWKLNPLKVLYTGNPISESGEFYDSHHSKAALWNTIVITAWDTPNVIENREVIPGLITRRDIRRHAENWGEDSPLYRMTVEAEWCEGMAQLIVVPLSWAIRAEVAEYQPGKIEVVGCDPAGRGLDHTVIYSRRGRVARLLWAVNGFDEMETVGWLKGYHDAHKFAHIVVDGVGLGSGIVSRLREQGIGVLNFIGGANASDSSRFADRNAEVWWRMREGYDAGLDVDEQPELRAQISSRKYRIESDKRIRLQSKDELRKSPDYGDALAMTFAVDWDISGRPRLSADSDVTRPSEYEQEERQQRRVEAEGFGRGSDLAPWSPSRWGKVRGSRRR